MPTYEYACRDCGNHLEVVQSFRDAPLTTCGVCGGSLRKVFSAAGIIFKGSGYYVTDSRAKAESGSKSSGKDSAKDSAKAETSESKPAESKSSEPGKSAESA
jgi:putative FmdB family regulatory protein